ncbi:uncharacterized protein LOC109446466 isoform X2 [Rhinolophus sinicus]|uniref:uncharacterized protein LOC109446466 isoform X2 n=1 Tax=Rhinolophus sinicus TaxID=89399 RepID=UPI003D7968FC
MGKKPKPSGPPPPRPSARPIPGSPGAKLDAPRPTQRPEPGDSPAPAPRLELEPRDGDLGKFFSGGGAKLPARRSGIPKAHQLKKEETNWASLKDFCLQKMISRELEDKP